MFKLIETTITILFTVVVVGAGLYVGFYEQLLIFIMAMGYLALGAFTFAIVGLFVAVGLGLSILNEKRLAAKIANRQALQDLNKSGQIFEQVKAGHSLITNVGGLQAYHALPIIWPLSKV